MFPDIEFDEVPLERRWRRCPVPAGTDLRGWKVGPVVPAVVHWDWQQEASKPCRHAMSSGKLFCNCQREPIAKRKLGYLPFLLNTGERVVVILSNLVAAQAKKLLHGDPVKLVRPTTPKAPIKIEPWPNYECGEEKTKRVRKYLPCNIEAWLLILWGDPLLARYFQDLAKTDETPPPIALGKELPFDVNPYPNHKPNANIVLPE